MSGESPPALSYKREKSTPLVSTAESVSMGEFGNISLDGRHESKARAQKELAELLRSIGATAHVGVAIATWADSYSSENEYWFEVAEDKIAQAEGKNKDTQKRIQELKAQRSRLEDDLAISIKAAQDYRREVDVLLGRDRGPEGVEFVTEKEKLQGRCLQQRLEQLVTVHRQLLRKFTSLELENGELKKKIALRNERIKQLETNARKMTGKLRIQIEKHVSELTNLNENIQSMKLEQQQRLEATQERTRHTGPRVVRGGHAAAAEKSPDSPTGPAVLRGGGGGGTITAPPGVASVPIKAAQQQQATAAGTAQGSSQGGLLSFFKSQRSMS